MPPEPSCWRLLLLLHICRWKAGSKRMSTAKNPSKSLCVAPPGSRPSSTIQMSWFPFDLFIVNQLLTSGNTVPPIAIVITAKTLNGSVKSGFCILRSVSISVIANGKFSSITQLHWQLLNCTTGKQCGEHGTNLRHINSIRESTLDFGLFVEVRSFLSFPQLPRAGGLPVISRRDMVEIGHPCHSHQQGYPKENYTLMQQQKAPPI